MPVAKFNAFTYLATARNHAKLPRNVHNRENSQADLPKLHILTYVRSSLLPSAITADNPHHPAFLAPCAFYSPGIDQNASLASVSPQRTVYTASI